ncbi:MAG: hypothetical protein ACREYC_13740 [Gammaproteobacteria bacterium]
MYQILTPAQHVCLPVLLCIGVFSRSLAAEENPFAGSKQISTRELVQTVLSRNPSLPAMWAVWDAAGARITGGVNLTAWSR